MHVTRRLLLSAILWLGGCTALDRNQRRTLDWLDAHLAPESAVARGCLLPLAIPVGLLGFAADTLAVNPALAVDDAWGDTAELLWEPRDETLLRRVFLVPLATLATPLVFTGDWLVRSLVPIGSRRLGSGPQRIGGP